VFSYVTREPVWPSGANRTLGISPFDGDAEDRTGARRRCTLILKPAEQTSLTALRLADFVAQPASRPRLNVSNTGNATRRRSPGESSGRTTTGDYRRVPA